MICPLAQCRALCNVLEKSDVRFVVVKGGGHSARQRVMRGALQREVPIFLSELGWALLS